MRPLADASPQELAQAVAELGPDERRSFNASERLRTLKAKDDLEVDAELCERSMGKFASAVLASSVERKSIEWLWQDYVPLGSLSLLYGPEGDGKSTFTAMLAARATLARDPRRVAKGQANGGGNHRLRGRSRCSLGAAAARGWRRP